MTILGSPNALPMTTGTMPLMTGAQTLPMGTQPMGVDPQLLMGANPLAAANPYATNPYAASPQLVGAAPLAAGQAGAQAIGAPLGVNAAAKAALKELGMFRGALTNTPGKKLKASVRAFQKQNGLKVTGAIDTKTRKALKEALLKHQNARPVSVEAGAMPNIQAREGVTPTGAAATLPMMGATGLPGDMTGTGASTAPQVNATNQSGLATGTNGATQSVTNRNETTADSNIRQPYSPYGTYGQGYGLGYASSPLSAWQQPGPSVTGAYYTNPNDGGILGFFGRLFS